MCIQSVTHSTINMRSIIEPPLSYSQEWVPYHHFRISRSNNISTEILVEWKFVHCSLLRRLPSWNQNQANWVSQHTQSLFTKPNENERIVDDGCTANAQAEFVHQSKIRESRLVDDLSGQAELLLCTAARYTRYFFCLASFCQFGKQTPSAEANVFLHIVKPAFHPTPSFYTKIHFRIKNLKAVGHSFQKIYHVYGRSVTVQNTDTVGVTDGPINQLTYWLGKVMNLAIIA